MRLAVTGSWTVIVGITLLASASLPQAGDAQSWCDQEPRAGYEDLELVPVSDTWFRVYEAEDGVYAIYEPYNFQEVISWLIVGSRRALLFDTGMGMSRISALVAELTTLPVTVVNSHTHYDHMGGNAEFTDIRTMDTEYSRESAKGIAHAAIAQEVAENAFCAERLSVPFDTAGYHIRPFDASGIIQDGSILDLGGREIEVLHVPGHTPDAVSLLDRERGLLWTGDTFYAGPIWLFFPGTDLDAYGESMERLAELAPSLTKVFPAHNTPVADPAILPRVRDAFQSVRAGEASFTPQDERLVLYEFSGFAFLMLRPGT
jgi:glyoxylase-like metal-dependent hydrolase (beta-lactamase superfamily II)